MELLVTTNLVKKLQEKLAFVSNLKEIGFGTLYCEAPEQFIDNINPSKIIIAVGNPRTISEAKVVMLKSFKNSIDLDSSENGQNCNSLYIKLERDVKHIDDLFDDDLFDEPFSLIEGV